VEDHRNLGDRLVADENREDEDREIGEQLFEHSRSYPAAAVAAPSARVRVAAWTICPSRVTQVPLVMSSDQSKVSFPSFVRWSRNAVMFLEYIWVAWMGTVLASRTGPWIVTLFRTTVSPGWVSSQFPPMSAARSTMTDPGFIPATAAAGMRRGAGS